MSFLTDHPRIRWAAPVAALAVVAGGFAAATQASAEPELPPRTAEELLGDLRASEPTPMSGTLVQSANLGLPALPGSTGGHRGPGQNDATQFRALVSGTHTLRLWYDGPERARVALVGTGGESDLIRNGRDVWIWSSVEKSAVHHTLPEDADSGAAPAPGPADLPMTPEDAAEKVLDRLEPTTEVSSDGTTTVAGRPAYELVLDPKSSRTLVDDVRIAVDAEKKIPLRVQVHSTASADPAFEVAFTDIDFSAPEPRVFEFDPPPGTEVTEGGDSVADGKRDHPWHGAPGDHPDPTVVGSGWEAVAILDVPKLPDDDAVAQFLDALPQVSGDWGKGRVLEGTLFSAILTDDQRLAVGMVAPGTLQSALDRS